MSEQTTQETAAEVAGVVLNEWFREGSSYTESAADAVLDALAAAGWSVVRLERAHDIYCSFAAPNAPCACPYRVTAGEVAPNP